MGLDIYLFAKEKQPAYQSTGDDPLDQGSLPNQQGTEAPLDTPSPSFYEVAYFRKFNALLNWVSTHVQEVENCEDIVLAQKAVTQLHNTLEQLTPNNCAEQFPTTVGFFFGSQIYDEYYWEDVKALNTLLTQLLAEFSFDDEQLLFHAWW